jgi:copper chaperone
MDAMQLSIEGMTCGHCAQSVTKELSQVVGIEQVDVDQPAGLAKVEYTGSPSEAELAAAVSKAGYKLVSVKLL